MTDEIERLKADNAALLEALRRQSDYADTVLTKLCKIMFDTNDSWQRSQRRKHQSALVWVRMQLKDADELIAPDHPGAELLRELDEAKQNRAALLRDRIDLLHERAELLAEVERLRGLVAHLEEQTDSQYDEAVTTADPDWRKHDSHEPPDDLAPAQLVCMTDYNTGKPTIIRRVASVGWSPGLCYRPALSASGLPLVGAGGLKPWARYVAKDDDDEVWQFLEKPTLMAYIWDSGTGKLDDAPDTHAKPGPWTGSLMEVER